LSDRSISSQSAIRQQRAAAAIANAVADAVGCGCSNCRQSRKDLSSVETEMTGAGIDNR